MEFLYLDICTAEQQDAKEHCHSLSRKVLKSLEEGHSRRLQRDLFITTAGPQRSMDIRYITVRVLARILNRSVSYHHF
jgi:hypothetical protein